MIADGIGARLHAGHWDGGFADTSSWSCLADGSRLAVVAFGDPLGGPLLLAWDRPADHYLPALHLGTDAVRLVVSGACTYGQRAVGMLGFRLHQEGASHEPSRVGEDGCWELWLLGDRRTCTLGALGDEVAGAVDAVVAAARAVPASTRALRAATVVRAPRTTIAARDVDQGLELCWRRGDFAAQPFYLAVVGATDGASIAVSDTYAELGLLGPVVEALRGRRWEVDRLYDSGNEVWLFRLRGGDGQVLVRSLACRDETELDAVLGQLRRDLRLAPLLDHTGLAPVW